MIKIIINLLFILYSNTLYPLVITNEVYRDIGDSVAAVYNAKIISLKYNLPFYYRPFKNSHIFKFDKTEKKLTNIACNKVVLVKSEKDFVKLLEDTNNTLAKIDIMATCEIKQENWITQIKKMVCLNNNKHTKTKESNNKEVSVALHIRKGNGGGVHYDGTSYSKQIFEHDRSKITYEYNQLINPPLDWYKIELSYYSFSNEERYVDKNPNWKHKFVPNQFYIDQIKKIYNLLNKKTLNIQLFTDDKNPIKLLNEIKANLKLDRVKLHYNNNINKPHDIRLAEDLYDISKAKILIRSQSYFARIAEFMGNHELVVSPLDCEWYEEDKLVATKIHYLDLTPNLIYKPLIQ